MTNGPPPNRPLRIWPRGCTKYLVAWAGFAAVAYFFLDPAFGRVRMVLAIAAGLLAVIGPGRIVSLILTHPETREDAIARGQLKRELKDGDTVMITGRATAHAPLTSPLSETPCVTYFYKIYRDVFVSGRRSIEPVYWGYASQPFNVDTGVTSFRIDAVPQLTIPEVPLNGSEVVERAHKFLQTTSPTIVGEGIAGVFRTVAEGSAAFEWFREVMTSESGDARHDWKLAREYDLSKLHFEEEVVPVEATVAVEGRWSSARNALVTRAGDSPATPVSVALGSLAGLQGTPASLIGMWSTAFIMTALLALLLWFGRDATWVKKFVHQGSSDLECGRHATALRAAAWPPHSRLSLPLSAPVIGLDQRFPS